MRAKIIGLLKLLLALSIPAVLIGGFFYAKKQAEVQLAEHEKFQAEHPPVQQVTVDNYELKEIDATGIQKWHLKAKQGMMESTTKDVNLVEVSMRCFDGPRVKMSFSAPTGVANEITHLVKLTSAPGKPVLCEGDGGAKLAAPKVELKEKNQFIASGGVTIVYPGVAKVTGSTVTGSLKDADLKNFKIVGRTHALIGHM
jgi:uncharacterized protein YneF (UPF0154 family)